MSLQPLNNTAIDRSTTAPFLLRLFWRQNRTLDPHEFSLAPPPDTSEISDYSSLLPSSIRQQSVQIYTWPTCTLSELTGLLGSVLPEGTLDGAGAGSGSVGARLVYKLIFPDTRGGVSESGRGKWVDKPLGSVVIGGKSASALDMDMDVDEEAGRINGTAARTQDNSNLEGDAEKTLADARFVIGDYVACTIYPPTPDGRVAPAPPPPPASRPPRGETYLPPPRGGPPRERENGYAFGGRGGSYRGGGGRGGAPPPLSEWRRGERPPPGSGGGGYGGGGRGGYRGGRGDRRPY